MSLLQRIMTIKKRKASLTGLYERIGTTTHIHTLLKIISKLAGSRIGMPFIFHFLLSFIFFHDIDKFTSKLCTMGKLQSSKLPNYMYVVLQSNR
jgi:hypothetical protein